MSHFIPGTTSISNINNNVGINILNPQATLDINGTLKCSSTGIFNSGIYVSSLDFPINSGFSINNIRNLKKASKFLNNCKYFLGDVTNIKSLKKIFFQIKREYKKIDFLICNYGNSNFNNNHLDFEYAFKRNFFTTVNTSKVG